MVPTSRDIDHLQSDYVICARPLTIHILKAYDESYSKVIRGHKYKDKENEKDKNTDKVSETPEIC